MPDKSRDGEEKWTRTRAEVEEKRGKIERRRDSGIAGNWEERDSERRWE